MNHYTQIHNRIRQIAEPLVNTITRGEFDRVDLSKSNIYPLLHIFIDGGSFNDGSTIVFNVLIGCWQQRVQNDEVTYDKYDDWTNEVDNMNETLAVLNKVWLKLLFDFEETRIRARENPRLTPEYNAYNNNLDGWVLEFSIEVPNKDISLCD